MKTEEAAKARIYGMEVMAALAIIHLKIMKY